MIFRRKGKETPAQRHVWTCSCCGERISGLPLNVAFGFPHNFLHLSEAEKGRSHCDSDFCLIENEDGSVERYIRCILRLPVPAIKEEFVYGVWMPVSDHSWEVYQRGFEPGVYEDEGCFGYLGNHISDFPDCFGLKANIHFQQGNARPVVVLHDADHPLVEAQHNGISVAEVEAIIAGLRLH